MTPTNHQFLFVYQEESSREFENLQLGLDLERVRGCCGPLFFGIFGAHPFLTPSPHSFQGFRPSPACQCNPVWQLMLLQKFPGQRFWRCEGTQQNAEDCAISHGTSYESCKGAVCYSWIFSVHLIASCICKVFYIFKCDKL